MRRGGIRTHGELAPSAVFKMAVELRESERFRVFSNVRLVRRPTRPALSRLVSTRWLYTWLYRPAPSDARQPPHLATRWRGVVAGDPTTDRVTSALQIGRASW